MDSKIKKSTAACSKVMRRRFATGEAQLCHGISVTKTNPNSLPRLIGQKVGYYGYVFWA